MKQRMLLLTLFYDPAVVSLDAINDGAGPITEEALFASIEACVTQGGVVRVSHVEADLVRLACGQNGSAPAHEWVGLTFVPVQPATEEVIIMEDVVDAY
ncbi:MAG TPA: hypothetical protein PLD25_32760 [Chloroflexota bacterium]|nr:hypothetical protein [Chloroflexota bacterium]HUM70517.1 hypothetical protein [Chloroflexota bacterium]